MRRNRLRRQHDIRRELEVGGIGYGRPQRGCRRHRRVEEGIRGGEAEVVRGFVPRHAGEGRQRQKGRGERAQRFFGILGLHLSKMIKVASIIACIYSGSICTYESTHLSVDVEHVDQLGETVEIVGRRDDRAAVDEMQKAWRASRITLL